MHPRLATTHAGLAADTDGPGVPLRACEVAFVNHPMAQGTSRPPPVLMVCGEASGDRIAAQIVRALARRGLRSVGLGGPACEASGMELVADLRETAVMGFGAAVLRLPRLMSVARRLLAVADAERPAAAVLVDYAEFNGWLGRRLRARGIPVLFCVAPQVWAWRKGRLRTLGRCLDRLAVILPFEQALWSRALVPTRYIGHPALATQGNSAGREGLRRALGLDAEGNAIALLPGSRPEEVTRHAALFLRAFAAFRCRPSFERTTARLLVASSLPEPTRRNLVEQAAGFGVASVDVDPTAGAGALLPAFDASVCVSGTATLESALAAAPPVIAYRMGPLSYAVARRLVRIPNIGLPNVVLGRRVYPELVQHDVHERAIADALSTLLLDRATFARAAEELRRILQGGDAQAGTALGERAVEWIKDWLEPAVRPTAPESGSPSVFP